MARTGATISKTKVEKTPPEKLEITETFNASPESFYQRLTNVLPKEFNLKNLFFLRFTYKAGTAIYHLKKELHLSHQHKPHGNEANEHYCRRWVSLSVLKDISEKQCTLAKKYDANACKNWFNKT